MRNRYMSKPAAGLLKTINWAGRGACAMAVLAVLATAAPRTATAAAMQPGGGATLSHRLPAFFQWPETQGATWYQLWINRNGATHRSQWVEGITEWTSPGNLPAGNYQWWVRPWSPTNKNAPWSAAASFAIPAPDAGVPPTLLSPKDRSAQSPWLSDFTYGSALGATWHNIQIERNGSVFRTGWSKALEHPDPNEEGGRFSAASLVGANGFFPAGNYQWKVRAWNEMGFGPWSTVYSFTVSGAKPVAPVPVAPEGPQTWFDRFEWQSANTHASWARIVVHRNGKPYRDYWTRISDPESPDRTDRLPEDANLHEGDADPRWPAGNYSWWVVEWSPTGGNGDWSAGQDFSVESEAAPKAAENLDTNTTDFYSLQRPCFSFDVPKPDLGMEQSASTTWVYFWLNRNGTAYRRMIFTPEFGLNQGASGTHDTFGGMMEEDLPAGRYAWWVQTSNSKGDGGWVAGPTFDVPAPTLPPKPVLSNAGREWSHWWGMDGHVSWTLSPGVYWYQIWVQRNGGPFHSRWFNFAADTNGQIFDEHDDWGGGGQTTSWADVNSRTREVTVRIQNLPPGNYTIWVCGHTYAGSRWSDAAAFTVPAADAWDPTDNTRTTATMLTPEVFDQTQGPHVLAGADTEDWFAMDLEAGFTYWFFQNWAWNDIGGRIFDSEGNLINAGWFGWLDFDCQNTGRYYLQVKRFDEDRTSPANVMEYEFDYGRW